MNEMKFKKVLSIIILNYLFYLNVSCNIVDYFNLV